MSEDPLAEDEASHTESGTAEPRLSPEQLQEQLQQAQQKHQELLARLETIGRS
ncbi:hypothetical protein [Nesterenkonia populi]|uniref:hypothetical protein n=1 Tax=Nesterenkonia populi TaxID=1591087 RepID=UPI001478CE6C|nr:hypothetical protein [Nesterenkonia populi]